MMRSLSVDVRSEFQNCMPMHMRQGTDVHILFRYPTHSWIGGAVGACLPNAECSMAGDTCCDGGQCDSEFLRCDETSGSLFGTTSLQALSWIEVQFVHGYKDVH